VVDTGISLEDCSRILVRACSGVRGIPLNKRQRLKPWIMAVLLHRYDRGIRDIDQLNTDSVYYRDKGHNGGSNSSDDGAALAEHEHEHAVAPPRGSAIDLRHVLTPRRHQVDDFIHRHRHSNSTTSSNTAFDDDDDDDINDNDNDNDNDSNDGRYTYDFTPGGQKRAENFLLHEKQALLATEARRIVSDRNIPLLELVPSSSSSSSSSHANGSASGSNAKPRGLYSYSYSSSARTRARAHAPPSLLKTEAAARKLSKQDPGLFLSLFSRAVAIAEKKKFQRFDAAAAAALAKQQDANSDNGDDNGDDTGGTAATIDALVEDFSHRRYQPPSLKKAVYQKRKDRERKEKDRAAAAVRQQEQQKQHANSMGKRGHHSKVVRKKLSAMSKAKKHASKAKKQTI